MLGSVPAHLVGLVCKAQEGTVWGPRPDCTLTSKYSVEPALRRCALHYQCRLVAAAPKQKIVTLGGRSAVAVVVPVYARTNADQVHLMAALDALSRQTRQPDYLVLVDDGSPLPIPSIIRWPLLPFLRTHLHV